MSSQFHLHGDGHRVEGKHIRKRAQYVASEWSITQPPTQTYQEELALATAAFGEFLERMLEEGT